MSGKANPKGVNNVDFRRKWDKEEFREKADQREEKVRHAVLWVGGRGGEAMAYLTQSTQQAPSRAGVLPSLVGPKGACWAAVNRPACHCTACRPNSSCWWWPISRLATRCACTLAPPFAPPPLQEKKAEDEALDAKKRKRLERDPLHQGLIVARANLKARDYQIDLAAKLHKTQVGCRPAPRPGRAPGPAAKLRKDAASWAGCPAGAVQGVHARPS